MLINDSLYPSLINVLMVLKVPQNPDINAETIWHEFNEFTIGTSVEKCFLPRCTMVNMPINKVAKTFAKKVPNGNFLFVLLNISANQYLRKPAKIPNRHGSVHLPLE